MSMECSSASTHPIDASLAVEPISTLQFVRERLHRTILDILQRELQNPAASPDWLAFQLTVVYREASAAFAPLWRETIEVEVGDSQVLLRQGAGEVELHRSQRGWMDTRFGLHGAHLAEWLSNWPLFTVPVEEPFGCSPEGLREALSRADERAIVYADEALSHDLNPIARDYVLHRIARWPADARARLQERRDRRFVGLGFMLLKAQSRFDLQTLLDRACDGHPGDARWLGCALERWLAPAALVWSPLVQRPTLLKVTWTPHAVTLTSAHHGERVTLQWRGQAWRVGREPERDVARALLEHMTGLEHTLADELHDTYDDVWDFTDEPLFEAIAASR